MGYRLISLAVISFTLFTGGSAELECPRQPKVRDALAAAAAVFSGEVMGEEYRDVRTDSSGRPAEAKAQVVKLKAEKWWKGSGAREIFLYTSARKYPDGSTSLSADDFTFRKGESYLVYASGPEAELRTSGCTRTIKLDEAGDDLRELGEGRDPDERPMRYVEPNKDK